MQSIEGERSPTWIPSGWLGDPGLARTGYLMEHEKDAKYVLSKKAYETRDATLLAFPKNVVITLGQKKGTPGSGAACSVLSAPLVADHPVALARDGQGMAVWYL